MDVHDSIGSLDFVCHIEQYFDYILTEYSCHWCQCICHNLNILLVSILYEVSLMGKRRVKIS